MVVGDQTLVGIMLGKHPTCYTITLAPSSITFFEVPLDFSRQYVGVSRMSCGGEGTVLVVGKGR